MFSNHKQTVSVLLQQFRAGDQSAFNEIMELYKPLIEKMVQKYSNLLEDDEIRQAAAIGLYAAACSYNDSQNKVTFGLYSKICINNRIVSEIRKFRSTEELKSDGRFICGPEENLIEKENYQNRLNVIEEVLTEYEKATLRLFLMGKSYREIGLLLGKSEKSVDNSLCRAKAKLKAAYNII